MIHYEISAENPGAHLFNIEMTIPNPFQKGQKIALANWIPGSYLIRDFARHIVKLDAYVNKKGDLSPIAIHKLDSNTWQCEPSEGSITLKYVVYAWDLSVRGAHLDETHAFINPCALLFQVCGQEGDPCQLTLNPPVCEKAPLWRVATTLTPHQAPRWGYGSYKAQNYDELIDHPIEMGHFDLIEFEIEKVPHYIVVSGKHDGDLERLARDVASICKTHINLFQEEPPFSQYLFLLTVLREGYGGLEHRSSTALFSQRDQLPLAGDLSISRNYINLLALFSHEYFHAWNIKRIRPLVFVPYDLNKKTYTQQLWAFEGITSYYDELALLRANVISLDQYLDLLAQTMTKLLRNPGRNTQTLLNASFDTWIKYYQPNENSVNALVSYYLKGSLVGLIIDLTLLENSQGEICLDDIMRILWKEYGKKDLGVPEGRIEEILIQKGGQSMKTLLFDALFTTKDLAFEKIFQVFGLNLTLRSAQSNDDLGGKKMPDEKDKQFKPGYFGFILSKNQNRMIVSQVLTDTVAMRAGISAQDEIVAINDIRIDADSFDKIAKRLKINQQVKIHLFRHDILMEKTLTLQEPPLDTAQITVMESLNESQKINLISWLKNNKTDY